MPNRSPLNAPRFGAAARASVSRKDFTDRLNLPADASNDQVFAAVDDELYAAAWTPRRDVDASVPAAPARAAATPPLDERELYAAAWPGDAVDRSDADTFPLRGAR